MTGKPRSHVRILIYIVHGQLQNPKKHSNNGLSVALLYCSTTRPKVLPVPVTLVFLIRVIKKNNTLHLEHMHVSLLYS